MIDLETYNFAQNSSVDYNFYREDAFNVISIKRPIDLLQSAIEICLNTPVEFAQSDTIINVKKSLSTGLDNEYTSVLAEDICELIDLFEKESGAQDITLRLFVVEGDMCKRFHTDMNFMRLLCTYSGKGTEWMEEDNINLSALNSMADNDQIVKDPSRINRAECGEVLILKGALYPDASAAVHRSPSIEKAGEKRLLMRIDVNENLF